MKMNSAQSITALNRHLRRLAVIAALTLGAFGCKNRNGESGNPNNAATSSAVLRPVGFIRQVRLTDSIVISNRLSGAEFTNENLSLHLSPGEVKDVVKAIGMLKANPTDPGTASAWGLQLQFFQGRKLLGRANFQGGSIVIDREYSDNSGILEGLYNRDYERLLPSVYRTQSH